PGNDADGPQQHLTKARWRERFVPMRLGEEPDMALRRHTALRLRLETDVGVRRGPAVTLPHQDLGDAELCSIRADPVAALSFREPAVQPRDKRLAEFDEGRTGAVVAGAVDEQDAEARRGLLVVLAGLACRWHRRGGHRFPRLAPPHLGGVVISAADSRGLVLV